MYGWRMGNIFFFIVNAGCSDYVTQKENLGVLKRMERKAGKRKSGGREKGEYEAPRAGVTDRRTPCSHNHKVYCLVFPGV